MSAIVDISSEQLSRDLATVISLICSNKSRLMILFSGLRRFESGAARGWSIGPDILSDHVCYQMLTGGCRLQLDGHRLDAAPGDFVWIRPGVRRTLHPDPLNGGFAQWYLRFRLGGIPDRSPPLLPWLHLPAARVLEAPLAAVVELHRRPSVLDDRLHACAVRGGLATLVGGVYGLLSQAGSDGGRLSAEQCLRLERFLAPRLAGRPTPADLARELGLSPRYFAGLFRVRHGRSPRTWLIEERIAAAARRLVSSADPIGAVAEAFGYPDIFLFSRQFRRVTGISPSLYRRGHG